MQVLFADVMKTAHQRPREQGPSIFHPVCRDSVLDVPHAMIDRAVSGAHSAKRRVGPQLVRVQLDFRKIKPFAPGLDHSFLFHVSDVPRVKPSGGFFDGSDHDGPIGRSAMQAVRVLVLFATRWTARKEFVHLDAASKPLNGPFPHSFANAVDHVPAALLADLQFPFHLERAKR
jgi:hypothetical protein